MGMKQETFQCCIVGRHIGGMQNAHVKLVLYRFHSCSCYCRDLSHCCSRHCSRCREGLRSCDVVQTGVAIIVFLKSSRCYSHWDECLLEMRRAVVWDRKLLERRVIIWTGHCFAGLSFGTGHCFAGLFLYGSCKKLEVVIAGPSFENRIVLLGIFRL